MGERGISSPPEPDVLASLHDRAGAVWGEERGTKIPLHYGTPGAELEAATTGAALVDLSWMSRLALEGADRSRFLNGLVTASTTTLDPGHGLHALVTNQRGRVLAEAYVMALEDRLWLELPAARGEAVREHLEKYRVIEDVRIAKLTERLPLALVGPEAGDWLSARCEPPEENRHHTVSLVDGQAVLARRRLFGVEAFVVWPPLAGAEETVGSLLAEGGLRLAGCEALETLRIEAGRGRWGVDFDEESVANETGLLDEAVDFEKGCYLGQEIVARIHYRGRPSVLCCPLAVEGADEAPPAGLEIRAEDETVGILTSVSRRRRCGAFLAIGRLEKKALEGGRELALENGAAVLLRR